MGMHWTGITWTMADTVSAVLAGGGAMLGLYLGRITERLLARRS